MQDFADSYLYSDWEDSIKNSRSRDADFDTLSGHPLDACYFPKTIDENYKVKLGLPGQYPFTRGIHSNLYRGRLWTMRQFAGYGTPEETNKRFKLLQKKGQTGLSVAYDMPTLMGYDPGHSLSIGEVGKCGVNVFHLGDMERLFKDINLGEDFVSYTFRLSYRDKDKTLLESDIKSIHSNIISKVEKSFNSK